MDLHAADAFDRGVDDVARVKREKRRSELDQLRHAKRQMAGPRALPRLPVDAEAKLEIVGRAHLVGRRQPRPQYRVAVGRLPEAALLAAANCDVQSDRVAGDVVERVAPADRLRGLADDERELHFMIVAAVELAQGDALTRAG